MALKKVAVLSMAVLFLLVAVSTSVSAARANHVPPNIFELLMAKSQYPSESAAVRVVRGKSVRGDSTEACCYSCSCTKSIPPKCACTDIFEGVHRCEGCNTCVCSLSMPPICRCGDITDSCKPTCSSSATTSTTNEAANMNYIASN